MGAAEHSGSYVAHIKVEQQHSEGATVQGVDSRCVMNEWIVLPCGNIKIFEVHFSMICLSSKLKCTNPIFQRVKNLYCCNNKLDKIGRAHV